MPVPLPCPECRLRGVGGDAAIGSRRSVCGTCNRWARRVAQTTNQRFRAAYPELWESARSRVEADLYPQAVEDFAADWPTS